MPNPVRVTRATIGTRQFARSMRCPTDPKNQASWFSIERKRLAGVSSRTCCAYALHASPTATETPINAQTDKR